MKNKLVALVLLVPFIVLTGWTLYALHFVRQSPEVVLPITGYDPRNILSGHYIRFQIDWQNADCRQADWNGVCPKADFKGVDTYYIPENRARELERKLNSDAYQTEVVFAYQPGHHPVAVELRMNGATVLSSR